MRTEGEKNLELRPGEEQPASNHRQYARRTGEISREVNGVRDQNTQRNLNRTVVDHAFEAVDNPPHKQAQGNTARR